MRRNKQLSILASESGTEVKKHVSEDNINQLYEQQEMYATFG